MKNIIIEGNKITKENIIARELSFKINDTINSDSILITKTSEAKKNLLNTSLFNFVDINIEKLSESDVNIRIKVTERWYLWPYPIFEFADRNFNVWWDSKALSRTNYGVQLVLENFRGRKETFKFLFKHGFDQLYGISYTKPYINKKQTIGISFATSYTLNHEINYKSFDNKTIYLKDNDKYLETKIDASIGLTIRPNIKLSHSFRYDYGYISINDTILKLNDNYLLNAESDQTFNAIDYLIKYDARDFKAYPLNGYYFDSEYNLKLINSNFYNQLMINFRKYIPLSKKIFIASGVSLKADDNNAYLYNKGLGYKRDYVRGYEYYVIEGNKYFLIKANLKYCLLKKNEGHISFIKNEKFGKYHYAVYFNLFADIAYIYDKNNLLKNNVMANRLLNGNGFGIDFVTYYDKVFRFEYSINHKNEKAFFIHFMTSI
ncbi:MAG: hypothetical protein A2X12_08380 [Bacteroidetes bacterium GWE2_29_8]|nr:MAG: hypothetical protein A2X12_08380 [Bacteroidetes bacterium GWE2_29_8]OFY19153.1 MAG: hypothetical protein A2X02_00490 [Bacteroidetes bacterium GWF2_29_10]